MGYWGDPAVGCESCDCYAEGSDSDVCDSVNGQCLCKPRFGGQKCDECELGYADVDLMCPPCDCDLNGSHNDICDPFSGQCNCKIGVTGLKCDECADEFFGMEEDGCEGKYIKGIYFFKFPLNLVKRCGLVFTLATMSKS